MNIEKGNLLIPQIKNVKNIKLWLDVISIENSFLVSSFN